MYLDEKLSFNHRIISSTIISGTICLIIEGNKGEMEILNLKVSLLRLRSNIDGVKRNYKN